MNKPLFLRNDDWYEYDESERLYNILPSAPVNAINSYLEYYDFFNKRLNDLVPMLYRYIHARFLILMKESPQIRYSDFGKIFDDIRSNGISVSDIIDTLSLMYLEYRFTSQEFYKLLKTVGYSFEPRLVAHFEEAKRVLHESIEYSKNRNELIRNVYRLYQNYKISFDVFDAAINLLGKSCAKDIYEMDDDQRRKLVYISRKGYIYKFSEIEAQMYEATQAIGEIDEEELFSVYKGTEYVHPMMFVEDYMTQKNLSTREVFTANKFDRAIKNDIRNQDPIDKINVYSLIFVLKLDYTKAMQFMALCGYTFSPLSTLDQFFLKYFKGQFKECSNLEELAALAKENGVEQEFPLTTRKKANDGHRKGIK